MRPSCASRLSSSLLILILAAAASGAADSASEAAPSSPRPQGDQFGRVYPARIYEATRLAGEAPTVDGRLDDAAWGQGEWSGGYTQQIPTEGAAPSHPTEIKILYDERNVYVAIRAYDDMEKIHRYSGRRDEIVGDVVGICFDSYFDKRTGFEFDLTAGGNRIDLVLSNDGWDTSWDAVWQGRVGYEERAWTAEIGIPLSQLRYAVHDEQVWGLHAWRWIDRNQEEDQWQLIPRNSTGRMYNLGELRGIDGLRPQRRIELLPYTLGKVTSDPREAGNPYRTGPAGSGALGLDAKIGLTSDFTLDATVNPDFGQVEADPSVMNLTAYETFYEEKRPFFLEGKSIMSFDVSGWGDRLFYSRRIGQAPSRTPDPRDDESLQMPDSTTILSALKVTGKTRDGLSVGLLQSLTEAEEARLTYQGKERKEAVEPLTSYTALRVHKDWDKGNTSLGGMLTSVRRSTDDELLEGLPSGALSGGIEVKKFFANRTYGIEASGVFSRISGSQAAIADLQSNAVHYFQRPDADHLDLDETATTLGGHGGMLRASRKGTSRWRIADTFRWRSPGLDLNAMGYQWQADLLNHDFEITFEEPRPHGALREYGVYLERWDVWDFGGLHTDNVTALSAWGTFSNKWNAEAAVRWVGAPVSTRLLRGGPAARQMPHVCANLNGHTDSSRRLSFELNTHVHAYGHEAFGRYDLSPEVDLRLSRRVSVSTDFDYTRNRDGLEYVATTEADGATRYVLGAMDQKTMALTLRLNVHLTPDLSIQFYGSPFLSTGRYTDMKRALDPAADEYADRFVALAADEVVFDAEANAYDVREAGGLSYRFDNPDFSFRELRANLVARWEYRPGSALYLVWSQGRTDSVSEWERSAGRNFDALWATPATDVFLVKLSHWFGL